MQITLRCRGCGCEFSVVKTLTREEHDHPLCPQCEAALTSGINPPSPRPEILVDPSTILHEATIHPSNEVQTFQEDPNRVLPSLSTSGFLELPRIEGYRVLGLLGKGGMGIVFKAEQEKANRRLVAIKMILARRGYNQDQDQRFDIEVNAVSSLEHPNIVRVYEVGEADGQRFFSMEYCSGGTLYDKLKSSLMVPKEAAKLIAVLARAMAVVHSKNIIHRDLKPLNILYDATGEPKITDFGLAKNIEADDGGTATGSIMGTLGYMSPEQASGQGNKATPETDVYALGAILYSCLTGRVPFAGSTVPDTLQQIQKEDPVSVRRLVPNTPRDLETICEKCLQKDAKRRYRNAGELADELVRYLEGRPILARPVSKVEKLLKAAKRRPAAAALLLTLILSGIGAVVGSVLLYLANGRERELRAIADSNAIRADASAQRARRFSEYVLHSLGETDFWTRYFPLYIGKEGKTGLDAGLRASPEYLRSLKSHAVGDFAEEHYERGKVLLTLANAMRSNNLFVESEATLNEAQAAFARSIETTPEDRDRLQFSRACYLHEVGELEAAYNAFDEILARPQHILSLTELADTKVRMCWLCGDRMMIRGSNHDATRQQWLDRSKKELDEAIAIYRTSESPLAREKAKICELLGVARDGNLTLDSIVKLYQKISQAPNGDILLKGITTFVYAELHRQNGQFPEAVAKMVELERLAQSKFGPQAHLRLLSLAALAGMEKTAFERSADVELRKKSLRDAIQHATEAVALGKQIAPHHAFLAEGYGALAQLYLADKQMPEVIRCLKESLAITQFHPVDLKARREQIEQELAKWAKP